MYFQFNIFSPSKVLGSLNDMVLRLGFAILTFLAGFVIGKLVEKFVYKVLHEIELNKLIKDNFKIAFNAEHFISTVLAYSIYFLSLVASLEQIGLANIIMYMVSLTIVLLILISFFLTVRDFFPNFVAGMYLFKKENLEVGKYVEVGDIKGKLIHVDLMQIKVQLKNEDVILIPNSSAVKSTIKIRKRKI